MTLDVDALRALFPSLASGTAHFDGPGGTQTPTPVAAAIAATLTAPLSNRGTAAPSERNAEQAVAGFRAAFADLTASPAAGIVHGRSATQLVFDVTRALAKAWGPGDEIVVSRLDHDANVRPWVIAAERAGATLRWLDLDPATADLVLDDLESVVTERTRVVAVTAASNLLGTMPDVARIAARAHEVGAIVSVDAVHFAAHETIDMTALGADLLVCSPYKFLGPHCGVLAGDPGLLETIQPDKLLPSTDAVPERFELGTLPYETLAGATAAVDLLASLGEGGTRRERLVDAHASIAEHETALRARLDEGLASLGDRVVVHSVARRRTPTTLLTLPGRSGAAASAHLLERDVLAPAGSFYAHEPSTALRLDDDAPVRVGLAPYSTADEVDRLLEGLADFVG